MLTVFVEGSSITHSRQSQMFRLLVLDLSVIKVPKMSSPSLTDVILKYFSSLVMSLGVALVGLGGVNLVF